jgi:hypothetical protein
MGEAERIEVIKAIQMQLFELSNEFKQVSQAHQRVVRSFHSKRNALKRQLRQAQATGRKTCADCETEMDIDQFYKDKYRADGRDVYCIECRGMRNKISRCLGSAA